MVRLRLKPGLPGRGWINLRTLAGSHELSVDSNAPTAFVDLLEALLVEIDDHSLARGEVADLTLSDLDRIAAELQIHYFGSRVDSSLACGKCQRSFELSFELEHLIGHERSDDDQPCIQYSVSDSTYRLPDGRRFRAPTARDAIAIARLPKDRAIERLFDRCALDSDFSDDPEVLESSLESVSPMLSQNLQADCPHCGDIQNVRFDLPTFFIESLAFERRYLAHEIHYLARGYGWSRREILSMERDDRRLHAQLILSSSH